MKKILYVDMDNVLTDFPAAIARQPREILEVAAAARPLLPAGPLDQLLGRQPDVLRDLPKKSRREVSAPVKRQRRLAAIRVAVLPMRAALSHQLEPESL